MFQSSSRIVAAARVSTRCNKVFSAAASSSRAFSGDVSCEPAQRIRDVLAEYKREHFSREIPTRFKKEVLQPYINHNDNAVDVEQLNLLLTNIGHPQHCLSLEEQTELLQAAGSNNRSITVTKMMELIE